MTACSKSVCTYSTENPLIGTCMTQQDPCQNIPNEKCELAKANGIQICSSIETCSVDPCHGRDECCGLGLLSCKQNPGCFVNSHCRIKPGMDKCSYHMWVRTVIQLE